MQIWSHQNSAIITTPRILPWMSKRRGLCHNFFHTIVSAAKFKTVSNFDVHTMVCISMDNWLLQLVLLCTLWMRIRSVMINHRQSYDLRICADYVLISESSWYTRGGVRTIQPMTYVWCSRKTMHIAKKKYVVLWLIQNAAPFLKIKQFTLLKYSNRNWIYRIVNKVPVRS